MRTPLISYSPREWWGFEIGPSSHTYKRHCPNLSELDGDLDDLSGLLDRQVDGE